MKFAKIFERDELQVVVVKGILNGVGFIDFLFSFDNMVIPHTVNIASHDLETAFDEVDEDVAFGAVTMFLLKMIVDKAAEENAS